MVTTLLQPRRSVRTGLRAVRLVKRYGITAVLHEVDFHVDPHEIVAVVGENGAGKSTLARILAGSVAPDEGFLEVGATRAAFSSPRDALRHGIAFIPQELAYIPQLTVAENLVIGRWPNSRGFTTTRKLRTAAAEAMERFGIRISVDARMSSLSLADRQLTEILKALMRDAAVLILDEPTASLSQNESNELYKLLQERAIDGSAIVYISHRLDEVLRFSHRVDVMRDGVLVASLNPHTTSQQTLIGHMLGEAQEPLAAPSPTPRDNIGADVELRNWTCGGIPALNYVNLRIPAGLVTAVFGVRGSGAELIAEGLSGRAPWIRGEVSVGNRVSSVFKNPRAAQRSGIAYVPAERKRDGLALTQTVEQALTGLVPSQVSRWGIVQPRRSRSLALRLAHSVQLRYQRLRQLTGELSGGNQQKVLVASRLAQRPRFLVSHEPTRGVDVGARAELHQLLRALARAGAVVLCVTSDVEEAVDVSDQLAVVRNGRLVCVLTGADRSQAAALDWATRTDDDQRPDKE